MKEERKKERARERDTKRNSFCLPLCDSEKEKVREAYCVRRNAEQKDVERHKS